MRTVSVDLRIFYQDPDSVVSRRRVLSSQPYRAQVHHIGQNLTGDLVQKVGLGLTGRAIGNCQSFPHIKPDTSLYRTVHSAKIIGKMEKIVVVALSFLTLAASQHFTRRIPQPIQPDCLKCLCQVDSNCTQSECTDEPDRFGGGPACGWYKFNKHYYRACGEYGRQRTESEAEGFERCATEKECAELCINNWLPFGKQCDPTGGEPQISLCESHARKHFGGPGGCWKPATDNYWKKVNECLKRK